VTELLTGASLEIGDLVLRRATLDDARFAADLVTAVFPDDPEDPVLTRHWWSIEAQERVIERFVALRQGREVGYAKWGHPPWSKMPERYGSVGAELAPELRTADRLAALLGAMEERVLADGARAASCWAWEHDGALIAALDRRGFRAGRRERFWELDLRANRARLLALNEASRARMREQGVAVATLDREGDPQRYRKLWRMSEEAEQDIPTTVPHTEMSFEAFRRWLASPGLRENRVWIARLGGDLVGISMLSYPPERGHVQTDWTATARSVRGRGVARALKCETVAQAIALGVEVVRTDNDGENAPILHLNETMGYLRRPDMIQFLKPLAEP